MLAAGVLPIHLVLQVALASLVADGAVQRVVDLQHSRGGISSCAPAPPEATSGQVSTMLAHTRATPAAHQKKLHDSLAGLLHHGRVRLDLHARASRHGAGSHWLRALLNL